MRFDDLFKKGIRENKKYKRSLEKSRDYWLDVLGNSKPKSEYNELAKEKIKKLDKQIEKLRG